MRFAKIGAVLYFFWGLVHIKAGLDGFGLGAGLESGLVQGKINQGAWDVLVFALAAIALALTLNWKNDLVGYWANLLLVSAADLGFIIFVLLPGHIDFFPGIIGPALWLGAALFSSLGIWQRNGG